MLIERYGFLGGQGTAGLVCSFAYGYHDKVRFITGGVFQEIREELFGRKALIKTGRRGREPFHPEAYKRLAFDLLLDAGVDILCHALIVDTVRTNDTIDAVIVETKSGRAAIRGDMFVDATGDGDVSARAGIPFSIGRDLDGATQPMTLMFQLGNVDIDALGSALTGRGYWRTSNGEHYLNATGFREEGAQAKCEGMLSSIPRVDVSSIFSIPWLNGVVGVNFGRVQGRSGLDSFELTEAEIEGKTQVEEGLEFFKKYLPGFESAQLLYTGPQIGVRETRRIHGAYTLTQEDLVEQRQFDDVIAQSCYMIDIHLPDNPETVLIKLPKGTHYDIPYRSLLPERIENLILSGRCISATHEALGSFRVQAISTAIGQAAGTAAALAIRSGSRPKQVDVGRLQRHLESDGAILS